MNNELLITLTTEEQNQRDQLEKTIVEVNQQAYIIIGAALLEVRDKRLYKSTHNTFADYALDVLDMARRVAYRYIQAAEVIANITTRPTVESLLLTEPNKNVTNWTQKEAEIVPCNEAQARELAGLTPAEQVNIWQDVIAVAKEGHKITAKLIREKVRAYKASQFKSTRQKTEQRTTTVDKAAVEEDSQSTEPEKYNKNFRSEEMQAAWKVFFDQVDVERKAKWRNTSRSTLYNDMMAILDVVGHLGGKELESEGCSMELSDREKLINAGFRIYRMVPKNLLIQEWRRNEWEYVDGFDSHKDMLEYFNALTRNDRHLRG